MRSIVVAALSVWTSVVGFATAVEPLKALPGTWVYSEVMQDSPDHSRSIVRQIRFEHITGGMFRQLWIHDFDELEKGRSKGTTRWGGVCQDQYQELDNNSLSLLTRDEFFEMTRDPSLSDIEAWSKVNPGRPQYNRKVIDGKLKDFFDGLEEYLEVLVFLDEDTFLLVKKENRFTTVKKYQRSEENQGEQGGAGEPATRAESDSKGSDKPKPESEGRSR